MATLGLSVKVIGTQTAWRVGAGRNPDLSPGGGSAQGRGQVFGTVPRGAIASAARLHVDHRGGAGQRDRGEADEADEQGTEHKGGRNDAGAVVDGEQFGLHAVLQKPSERSERGSACSIVLWLAPVFDFCRFSVR